MIADESDGVGTCPRCGTPVPPSRVLIEYEADGERRLFAECPGCRDVVDPHADPDPDSRDGPVDD